MVATILYEWRDSMRQPQTMLDPRLQGLLSEVGLPLPPDGQMTIDGHDPVLANRYPVGEAAAVALAAGGVAVSELWRTKTGHSQNVRVEVRRAGLSLRAS